MSASARAPRGLGSRGRTAWKAVTARFEFRPDEAELLREWCRTLDVIEDLRLELAGQPYLVPTPRDGIKINPLVTEQRQQRKLARELAAQLKLPDSDAAFGVPGTGPWDRRSHRRRAG